MVQEIPFALFKSAVLAMSPPACPSPSSLLGEQSERKGCTSPAQHQPKQGCVSSALAPGRNHCHTGCSEVVASIPAGPRQEQGSHGDWGSPARGTSRVPGSSDRLRLGWTWAPGWPWLVGPWLGRAGLWGPRLALLYCRAAMGSWSEPHGRASTNARAGGGLRRMIISFKVWL